MRRCISEPTTRFPRPAPRSVATSASTTPSALIRALTGKRRIMLTSVACSRSRQPEPGRGATYLNRNAVQTNRATADRQDATLAPRADPELLPRQEAAVQRRGGGSEQQGQTDHAKILRFPHLPRHRNRLVSCTW